MKKIIQILVVVLLITGCASYSSYNFNNVTLGMSQGQVRNILGPPERILAVNQTREGRQEVLQYRTPYDEVYALEFWNDRLTGYEFLYDDIIYVPSPAPPIRPPYGQPIFPNYRPPQRPDRPNQRPPGSGGSSTRPPSNTRPPSTGGSSTRPPSNTRPPSSGGTTTPSARPPSSTRPPAESVRPDTSSPSENTRPATRPATSTERNENSNTGSTRPATNRSDLER